MQETFHIRNKGELEAFFNTIRTLVQNGEELTITISAGNKSQSTNIAESEREKLFYSLFGSWEGDEIADEMIKAIYDSRISGTREIEL